MPPRPRLARVIHVTLSAAPPPAPAPAPPPTPNWKALLAGGLLVCSEALPFLSDTRANGIAHALLDGVRDRVARG